MIKYSDRYYVNEIQITSEMQIWSAGSINSWVNARYKKAEVSAFKRNTKKVNIVIDEDINKIKQIQTILSKIDFKKEIDNCSKSYVSCILYNSKEGRNKKQTHYVFSGYYDAYEDNKKGYIYSLTMEKIVYDDSGFDYDDKKCKELQLHISKNGKEKLEGDLDLFTEYPKFERHKAAFLKHCEKEFAKCKGAFHLVKDKK